MAQTLTNFLIGIGFDTKDFDKGQKRVTDGLGSIKTGALLSSASLAGAFSTMAKMAIGAGDRIDQIALASAKFNTSAKFVNNYGNALRLLGGQATESMQAVGAAEEALAQFKIKGSFAAFQDPALTGIDTTALTKAASGEEFLRLLSDMLPSLNKDQQRLIQNNFGFSDATMASLRDGSAKFDAVIAKAEALAPGFDAVVDSARAFNEQLAEIKLKFEGIGNNLGEKLLPALAGILGELGSFIDKYKPQIKTAIDVVAKSPGAAVAVTAGSAAAVTGAIATKVGLKAVGSALSVSGGYGTLAGIGMLAASMDDKDIESLTGVKLPHSMFQAPRPMGSNVENLARWKVDNNQQKSMTTAERLSAINSGRKQDIASMSDFFGSAQNPLDLFKSSPDGTSAETLRLNSQAKNESKRTPIQNNINLNVELGGQALDSRIVDVTSRRETNTIEDIKSTTAR